MKITVNLENYNNKTGDDIKVNKNAGKSKSSNKFFSNLHNKFKSTLDSIKKGKIDKDSLKFIIPGTFILVFGSFFLISSILNQSSFYIDESFKLVSANYEYSPEINISNVEYKDSENPLNGNKITSAQREELDNKKVLAITMNNHEKARPQYGLSKADIVMEVLTEGGITRYVTMFYGNQPEKIGPVRSVRRYMLDYLAEYDNPVILHEGGASFNDSDSVYVRETDAFRDIREYGYKSLQTAASRYRDPIKAAKSGYVHSLYTNYEIGYQSFLDESSNRGWETTSTIQDLIWKEDDVYEDRGNFESYTISFIDLLSDSYSSGFVYNKDTNLYERFIAGNPDIDQNNNQQISPKNVIIEWHNYRLANDGYSRIIIDMIGEDDVTILRDGKVIDATWKKNDRTDRTKYFDENGDQIELNRGQIWKVIAVKSGINKYSNVEYKYVGETNEVEN